MMVRKRPIAAVIAFWIVATAAARAGGLRLENAELSRLEAGRFAGWAHLGSCIARGESAEIECASAEQAGGLMQIVRCDPPITEPFTASARAKAVGVGSGGDFAVWLDLIHKDGSPSWGHVAGFARGTHGWEKASVDIVPTRPVAEIRFHLLLRNTTGKAWFAEPRLELTPLAFTRVQSVAGLWGPRSLSVRAETNLPAIFETPGLGDFEGRGSCTPAAGGTTPAPQIVGSAASQPALAQGRSLCLEIERASDEFLTSGATVAARALRDSANRAQTRLRIERADATDVAPAWRTWLAGSMTRVFADTVPQMENGGGALSLDVLRDGHASVQVAVAANPHGPDQAVEVAMSDLTGESATLAGESWKRHRVGFIRCEEPARHPHLEHAGPAWWPDPLLQWQSPLRVPRGQTRSVVFDIRIPRQQQPGTYTGHVLVSSSGGRTQRLPINLRVHEFTLPDRPRIKTAFALMDGFLEKLYGKITPELRRAYTQFVLDHRLNPDDISRTRLPDLDELTWAKDHGLNAFNILNLVPEARPGVTWVCYAEAKEYSPQFRQRLIERLDAFVPELEKRGLLELAYVYGFDERGQEYIPIIREYFGLIKQRYPRVHTLSTCWPPAGTNPASLNIDWYCPLSNKYDPVLAEKARSNGGQMWWYICMGPTWPYANWLFEYPLVEARLIWWQTWQEKVDGFLYWGLNIWDRPHNDKPIADDADPMLNWSVTPFEPLHGDGVLLYPGQHGPLGSLRLLNIRDGMEDAMLLDAAANRLGRERVEKIVRAVTRGMTDFTRDSAILYAARRAVLAELEGNTRPSR